MFSQHCPRCQSERLQLGFNDAPLHLRAIGMSELLCNNCNLEFKGFTLFGRLKRVRSSRPEARRNRRRAPRYRVRLAAQASQVIKDPVTKEVSASLAIEGYVRVISSHGLALVLPCPGINGHDFTDTSRRLWVRLELPAGPVSMRVAPVNSEQLIEKGSAHGWLIGASIRKINDHDQHLFRSYLNTLH